LAKLRIPEPKQRKIGLTRVRIVFIGYVLENNVNWFNSAISEISNFAIIEARDAIYFENIFTFKTTILRSIPSSTPISFSAHSSLEPSLW